MAITIANVGKHATKAAPRFLFAMALLIAAVVAYGFSFTIDKRLLHAAPPKPWVVWLHAAIFFGWIGLFLVQTALVSARQIAWHRKLGATGLVLGGFIPIVGITTALISAQMKSAAGPEGRDAAEAFLIIPLNDMLCFTTLFACAATLRRKPEYHRRLMFLATCCVTAAAFPRMPFITITAVRWYGGVDALIVMGIARDLLIERRLHQVYRIAMAPLLISQTITMTVFINRPPFWMAIADKLIG